MKQLREKFFAQFPLTFPEITSEDAEKAGGFFDAEKRIVQFDSLEKAKAFCEAFGLQIRGMLEEESEPGRFCVHDEYVDSNRNTVAVVWNLNWCDDYFLK